MNPADLIYFSAAERKLIEFVLAQESANVLADVMLLAEQCCEERDSTFAGWIGEA